MAHERRVIVKGHTVRTRKLGDGWIYWDVEFGRPMTPPESVPDFPRSFSHEDAVKDAKAFIARCKPAAETKTA